MSNVPVGYRVDLGAKTAAAVAAEPQAAER